MDVKKGIFKGFLSIIIIKEKSVLSSNIIENSKSSSLQLDYNVIIIIIIMKKQ